MGNHLHLPPSLVAPFFLHCNMPNNAIDFEWLMELQQIDSLGAHNMEKKADGKLAVATTKADTVLYPTFLPPIHFPLRRSRRENPNEPQLCAVANCQNPERDRAARSKDRYVWSVQKHRKTHGKTASSKGIDRHRQTRH